MIIIKVLQLVVIVLIYLANSNNQIAGKMEVEIYVTGWNFFLYFNILIAYA